MGFDLYGERPKNKVGEYFRNSVWYWRPLWNYVALVCEDLVTKTDVEEGHQNCGRWIRAKTAKAIAEKLTELLNSGEVRRYKQGYARWLQGLPRETCVTCKGTGKRSDDGIKSRCNTCEGKGKTVAYETNYPFTETNVREFAEFCKQSGGFRIF